MGNVKWTFSPYNELVYNKSKNRVMFVGAEPNGEKEFRDGKGRKIKINDMGEWFRKGVQSNGTFYKRTMIMLNGILPHINDSQRKDHMRFVDLKITAGGSKADENDVLEAVESYSSIVNEFFNSINYPQYVVFTGGISHTIWKKIRLNKINGIQFNEKSKAVLMPHPKPREGTNENLKTASKNLNIKDSKNKFRPIMQPLWRWSVRTGNWSDR
tara:strand:+ start:303 stop:941 length:639 start_codon:yes stop_codon:yes gene_type:complete